MKRFNAGLACCAVGVMLFAVNWLGAAAAVSSVTEWSREGLGRMGASFSIVGYLPIVFGVLLLIGGLVLIGSSTYEPGTQPDEMPAGRGGDATTD